MELKNGMSVEVPEDIICSDGKTIYIEKGKYFKVFDVHEFYGQIHFSIVNHTTSLCRLKRCFHLNGLDWIIKT